MWHSIKLINEPFLIINNYKYNNIHKILLFLDKFLQDQNRKLLPKKTTSLIHGDPHFENILVKNIHPTKITLLDPHGFINGPVNYGLGKLLHSIDGYDLVHSGRFLLEREGNRYDADYAD